LKSTYLAAILSSVALSLSATTAVRADGSKPTVAVYADQNSQQPEYATRLADVLSNQIVEKGDLAVVDREHTKSILAEQSTSSHGQVTPATEAQLGRMLGVNYLVIVRIDSLTAKAEQRGDVLSLLSKTASYVTKVQLSDSLSIVDVRSAQVVQTLDDDQSTTSPPGTAANNSFVADAMTPLFRASAASLSAKIDLTKLANAPVKRAVSGKVLDVSGSDVTLSLGKSAGIQVGDLIDLFTSRSVLNPDTGKTIETLRKQGQVQVTQVEDDYSIAKPISGSHPVKLQVARPAAQ
jgi:curli biogenesis system outer membrane secretion channel CsgG